MGLFGCLKRRKRDSSASGKHKALEDKYELLQQIGEGKTGQVFVARRRHAASNHAEVAVKIVRMEYLNTPARQEALRQELEILAFVKHPAVLKVFDVFQDEDKVAIVTEKASGGELMAAICDPQRRQHLRECDVVFVVRELLGVLAYLHAKGITHRDLKMENVLCKSSTQNIADGILLIDFGLAHKSRKTGAREMSGMNGTCHYMAPEMFGRDSTYGCEVDLWALGVVTYILLFGCFPFDAKFTSQIEDKIVACDLSFPEDLAPLVSREATKFIQYLLVVNPHERPPAAMALQHPWLQTAPAMTQEFSAYHMDKLRWFIDGKKVFSHPAKGKDGAYVPPQSTASEEVDDCVQHEPRGRHEHGRVHRVRRRGLGVRDHEGQHDHRDPELHGRVKVKVLERGEHHAREKHARAAFERARVLAARKARARRVLVLAERDAHGLRESVADARDEDENEHEVGLRRALKEPPEEQQHEEPREHVARDDPLERVRSVFGPIQRVELQHEKRRLLADRLDEHKEPEQRDEVTPRELERPVAVAAIVGLHKQRDQIRREQLELARVVDFERRVALRDDVPGLVDDAEEAADDAADRGHAHHHGDLGHEEEPERGVRPQLRLDDARDHNERDRKQRHADEEDKVKRARPAGVVPPGDLARVDEVVRVAVILVSAVGLVRTDGAVRGHLLGQPELGAGLGAPQDAQQEQDHHERADGDADEQRVVARAQVVRPERRRRRLRGVGGIRSALHCCGSRKGLGMDGGRASEDEAMRRSFKVWI